MSLYNLTLRYILDSLPNQITEFTGETFYKFAASLFPMVERANIEYSGIEFNNPFGVASGWADTFDKIEALHTLGAGAVVSKTITVKPKVGNPYPRYKRISNSMINSMGLPNKGLKYWLEGLQKRSLPQPTFLSIKGNTIAEWRTLIGSLSPYTSLLELNLSCPNVEGGILDIENTLEILESIHIPSNETKKFLKLSPQYSDQDLLELTDQALTNELIDGITVFNTQPVKTQYVGNPTHSAGYSGPKMYPRLIKFLHKARLQYTLAELPIFALGGIQSGDQAYTIFREYQSIPFFLTALLTQGPLIFREWINSIV